MSARSDAIEPSCAPLVSIIIPCYKVSRFIRDTLNGILAEAYSNWEAIIVDDGSPDDIRGPIADLLDSDSRLHYVSKPNGGVSSARNVGFHHVSKDAVYLLFLDGDDALTPFALRRMVETLERHPRAGMVHCDPLFVDENGRILSDVAWSPRWSWGPRILTREEPVTPFESMYALAGVIPSLSLIRRSVYEQTPGWDEELGQHCEDTDIFLHLALRSEVRYLPEKLVRHRRHSGQSTADISHLRSQEQKLYAKWTHMAGLTPAQRAVIAKAECFRSGPLAARRGFDEAWRYLQNGEILTALRFFLGAVRRNFIRILRRNTHIGTWAGMSVFQLLRR